MKRYFSGIFGVVRAYGLRFWRDKVALFFTFLFPLMFLLVFGSIFGNSDMNFDIVLIDDAKNKFSKQFVEQASKDDVFKINAKLSSLDKAKESMSRGEIDSIIVLPKGFGDPGKDGRPTGEMEVYYQPGSEQAGQTVAAIMTGVMSGINKKLGQSEPLFSVKEVSVGKEGLNSFDYVFSGLLGFTIVGSTIFGMAYSLPAEKRRGSLRRFRSAPFKSSQLIIGNGLHYLTVTIMSLLLVVSVGIALFGFNMRGSWLVFAVFALLSSIMMLGFGLLIAGWARNENQAAPLSNIISFPMMFMSGAFFPRFMFPEWLKNITEYVPLSPVIDGFRLIMTENASLGVILPQLTVMGVWLVVTYVLAFRIFRWE